MFAELGIEAVFLTYLIKIKKNRFVGIFEAYRWLLSYPIKTNVHYIKLISTIPKSIGEYN